jgi:uncharacterized protein YjiS (DUF1127 family)
VQWSTRKRTSPESEPSKTTPEEPKMLTKLARTKERRLFRKKATQLDEEAYLRLSDIGVTRTLVNFISA